MKRLIRLYPQHFVTWLLGNAIFKRALSIELKNWTRETDFLLEVLLEGVETLLHIEFQSADDASMEQRMLEYNVLATREHNRKVFSCVIYLRKDSNIAKSPLVWKLSNGKEILRFHFEVIKLWEIPVEILTQSGLVGLLPLVPLAKGGEQHEAVEEMITELVAHKEYGLLQLAKTFASLVYKDKADHEWLERSFTVYRSILEDSWVYQEIIQKGMEQGLQQGLQQGFQQGELIALRQAMLDVIEEKFPEVVPFVEKPLENITDKAVLRRLLVKMITVQSPQEVIQIMLEK